MNVQEMLHRPTVERCVAELESGLDVHRWLRLWGSKGREVDEAVAVAFYHQALQDAREALTALSTNNVPHHNAPHLKEARDDTTDPHAR